MTYPNSATESATYNAVGTVATRTNRAGDRTDFTYDNLRRLTAKTPNNYTAPTVTYGYDLAGRLTGVSDDSDSIPCAIAPGGTDCANPGSVTYTTTYTYDNLDRRTGIGWDQVDAQATPTYATVTFGHSYNAVNRRSYQAVDDNTWWYYPAASASTTSYTANAMNQYTAVGSGAQTYDSKGNLKTDSTASFGFTYDAENRMTVAQGAGHTMHYAWDGRGRRKAKTVDYTTTIYVTDADNRELLEGACPRA